MRSIRGIVGGIVLMSVLAGCSLDIGSGSTPASLTPIPSPTVESDRPPDLSRFYEQEVDWTACGDAECATVLVPMDYADPFGATVDLAVARVSARDSRLGSLFVNPGGPGGSAVDYAKAADFIVSESVRDHYDIVGVDPRGVGQSDPVECLTDDQRDQLAAIDGTPDSPAEQQSIIDTSALPADGCARKASPEYRYVGTVNAARDLDVVRAVVGDPTFNYLGKSYGTNLGAVYAELFPTRVGRMVLDGVLPPGLDLAEVSLEQARSFEETFDHFAADCASHDGCPFSGTGPEVAEKLRAFLQSLDENPIPGDKRKLDEALATYAVLLYLYFPSTDYPQLRDGLRSAVVDGDGGPLLAMLDDRLSRAPDGRYLDNSTDAFYAVTCADRVGTIPTAEVEQLAEQWARELPTFGAALAWGLTACSGWAEPGDPPMMQVKAAGSAPILIVSTTHDPATPHKWGQLLARELDNARLITRDSWGHTAYGEGSSCIDDAVDDYLLAGTLPAEGTVCKDGG